MSSQFTHVQLIVNDINTVIPIEQIKISGLLNDLVETDKQPVYSEKEIMTVLLETNRSLYSDVNALILQYYGNKMKTIILTPQLFPDLKPNCLSYLFQYMEHQNGVKGEIPPQPLTSLRMNDIVKDEWVADFADEFTPELKLDNNGIIRYLSYSDDEKKNVVKTRELFFDVLTTCDMFGIDCLFHILCAKLASMIKDKSANEIKGILKGTYEVE